VSRVPTLRVPTGVRRVGVVGSIGGEGLWWGRWPRTTLPRRCLGGERT